MNVFGLRSSAFDSVGHKYMVELLAHPVVDVGVPLNRSDIGNLVDVGEHLGQ